MRNKFSVALLTLVLLAAPCYSAAATATSGSDAKVIELHGLGRFTLSGPYRHDNLSLYLVHGDDRPDPGIEVLSLSAGMKGKQVVVHETDNVNRLTVVNKSDRHVFLQAGDIVRGGKQDRIIVNDLLLPPQSGKVPVAVFCVEQGRWNRRDNEPVRVFASSANAASGGNLKLAVREAKSQTEVWERVTVKSRNLSRAVAARVSDERSPTSMELVLENKDVKKRIRPYVKKLSESVATHDDLVGVVAVVNGRIHSASLYNWPALFAQLWPKTLSGLAVEAVEAKTERGGDADPSLEQVADWLISNKNEKRKVTEIRPGQSEYQSGSDGKVRFVSHHEEHGWMRMEVLSKDK
jgi:hypothetical protein